MSAFTIVLRETWPQVNRWRAGGLLAIEMTGRYFDRLCELTNDFEAAFRAKRKADDYFGWQFLDDYNPAELEWLYTEQYVLYGSGPRLRLLATLLKARGISIH
jgi:hypothetical protein